MDQRLLAAPHGFSQRATSFIASWCQGIHRTPFSCSQPREHSAEAPCSHLAQEPSNPFHNVQNLSPSRHRPIPDDCENNHPAETDAPSSTSILFTPLNTLRLRGLGSLSRSSSGQTCNRRVQTRQTLIHMSKEQNQASQRRPGHIRTTIARPRPIQDAPLNARTICSSHRDDRLSKWRWTVSNRRPPACKAGALPLSYTPRRHIRNERKQLFLVRKSQRTFIT